MKKLFISVAVCLVLLASTSSIALAMAPNSATNVTCDSSCISKVLERKLSDAEMREIGYGNVIKTVTSYLHGNLDSTLWLLGMGDDTISSNGNANAVYGTQLNGTVQGLVLCSNDSNYCQNGNIWGYSKNQDEEYFMYICSSTDCERTIVP